MRTKLGITSFIIVFLFGMTALVPVFADAGYWEGIEREIRLIVTEAYYRSVAGDGEGAAALMDAAFSEFQKTGFDQEVRAVISPARADNIGEWFEYVKTTMREGKDQGEVREHQNELLHLMRVTANRLDGREEPPALARSWGKTAEEMAAVLKKANDLYLSGDPKGAKGEVDVAYFQFYEKVGFEKIVMSRISGARAAQVEYQFSAIKKAINKQAPREEITAELETLSTWLREDAAELDGREESALVVFLGSLLIILREGFEAIIIVGAIIAYLLKSGNKKSTPPVYWG
ncbi:MAG: FTR1 family protein, partial [Spirochaetaceae bacterium]|nr:FTR1 family protein [Spirochaetaceae bacterium]